MRLFWDDYAGQPPSPRGPGPSVAGARPDSQSAASGTGSRLSRRRIIGSSTWYARIDLAADAAESVDRVRAMIMNLSSTRLRQLQIVDAAVLALLGAVLEHRRSGRNPDPSAPTHR